MKIALADAAGDWTPTCACPACRQPLDGDVRGGLRCAVCATEYPWREGVLECLTRARAETLVPFLEQYRQVRAQDGYRSASPDDYRCLPIVPGDHPHAAEWGLRRESFANLQRRGLPSSWSAPLRILDLGAGCGWLSHRLASVGHHAVAVDCLLDEQDGLRACRYYPMPILAVQADFDRLPFDPGQFDVIIFNGSLHYAPDPDATIRTAATFLVPGGTLAIVDSPMFVRAVDGEAMVIDHLARLTADYGIREPIRPGQGYLTFTGVEGACEAAGLRASFIRSRGVLPWRVRRQFARLKLRRAPAAFGVWVAR